MTHRISKTLVFCLLLLCFAQFPVAAVPRDPQGNDPTDIKARLIRLLKKIEKPIARLFEDGIVIPKP
jgi:hypothetical protein